MRRTFTVAVIFMLSLVAACSGSRVGSVVPAPAPANRVEMNLHMLISGPHKHRRHGRGAKFVSPSTNGVLVAVYPHGAARTPANLIVSASIDVSSGSTACGGQTGFPRMCSATLGTPPTQGTGDDFVVSTYDAVPVSGSFTAAHILGYGTLLDEVIHTGMNNALTIYLGGVIDGLSGNPASVVLPGDGKTHVMGIAIDPVDFGNNPITGYSNDPFANPIVVAVNEGSGSGHALLSLNGGPGALQVTVNKTSDSVQLQYDGKGTLGYRATVSLTAPTVQGGGGATETAHVNPLLLSGSNEYTPGVLALHGNGDWQDLTISENGAANTTAYTVRPSNCFAIADRTTPSGTGSSASFVVYARGTISTPPPGSGCVLAISDGSTTLDVAVTNAYSGILGTPAISEFGLAAAGSKPTQITVGPDGAMWFTECANQVVGRITAIASSPGIVEYTVPFATYTPDPEGIAAGPDGNIWFTDSNTGSRIGSVVTTGVVTLFSTQAISTLPRNIVAGPDDAMWFTDYFAQAIGRVPTNGAPVTTYTNGLFNSPTRLRGITLGADGNLWFVECFGYRVGKITTDGTITEFTDTLPGIQSIAAGPDGALWFTEAGVIGRIPTTATALDPHITHYSIPTSGASPYGITTGPDGALWFTEFNKGLVGRLDPSLAFPDTTDGMTEYTVTAGPNSDPDGISAGPDGAIWFTEQGATGNNIGRVAIQSSAMVRRAPRPHSKRK